MESKKILQKIKASNPSKKQINFEIGHSFKSIIVFGFTIIPVIYLVRTERVELLPDTFYNVLLGLVILVFWNEIYFYISHRFLHSKFMMKHVHHIHHKSTVPTVYSVFSFHWVEALILSSVPLTIIPFVPLSIVAVFIYPFVSILLNFAGHCNYRFGKGQGDSWVLLGTYHNQHHSRGRKNYGFAINLLDKLFSKQNR